ncbi:ABC transporter ATP-binding protein [Herbiconiux sp. KACC 21604]|uniref:ABC transporter ATP-binding protein n=1 Tax=unclassified Herbiconiux TaxID=2618217 RepID=UPI001492291C|nr:ABC transporter ATP-binding protein [Herbiconiux sp. SALV-R1]QJU53274.1 ABC transporter ATP-binding protein [Herbiconiux sp. SALV-R1]WPO88233.1 ABC transporter ATP-binding protein [Herbiconiux sp. KACC 21604]
MTDTGTTASTGTTTAGTIEISGVGRTYTRGSKTVQALTGVDLSIRQGEFITLFGPSGCGKSTLLRLIAGLDTQTTGDISVFGTTPKKASQRKDIAWIPQSSALLPWLDIKANASLSSVINKRADRGATTRRPEDAVGILSEVGLGDFLSSRPDQLSGGMRQRASIARGFAQGAPLMLMDEPFSALDELTRDTLRIRLLELWEHHKKTIVFVTHSAMEAVLLSDRVVVMSPRPGRIREVVDVDLPRPRTWELTETPEFTAKVAQVKQILWSAWEGDE